jgi:hypothetical protein
LGNSVVDKRKCQTGKQADQQNHGHPWKLTRRWPNRNSCLGFPIQLFRAQN